MTPEAALVARLVADPAVSALVVDRVSPQPLPQASTLPAVTYYIAGSTEAPLTHDRKVNLPVYRVSIDAWAATPDVAAELMGAIFDALHGQSWLAAPTLDIQLVKHAGGDRQGSPMDELPFAARRIADFHVHARRVAA